MRSLTPWLCLVGLAAMFCASEACCPEFPAPCPTEDPPASGEDTDPDEPPPDASSEDTASSEPSSESSPSSEEDQTIDGCGKKKRNKGMAKCKKDRGTSLGRHENNVSDDGVEVDDDDECCELCRTCETCKAYNFNEAESLCFLKDKDVDVNGPPGTAGYKSGMVEETSGSS